MTSTMEAEDAASRRGTWRLPAEVLIVTVSVTVSVTLCASVSVSVTVLVLETVLVTVSVAPSVVTRDGVSSPYGTYVRSFTTDSLPWFGSGLTCKGGPIQRSISGVEV